MTDTDGRIDLIVRSARGKQGKKNKPLLPFCLYDMSWVGGGDLKNLQSYETIAAPIALQGQQLFCGLYLNELLYHLLPALEADLVLMRAYSEALWQLSEQNPLEPILRIFEVTLLEKLGYGIDFFRDASGVVLDPERFYRFVPEQGLLCVTATGSVNVGKGSDFIAIGNKDFSTAEARRLAKITMRAALASCLGGKKLRSRELFL